MIGDTSCYTGCTTPTTGIHTTLTTQPMAPHAAAPVSHAVSTLPFTGADIGELVVIGLLALGAGIAMSVRARRHA